MILAWNLECNYYFYLSRKIISCTGITNTIKAKVLNKAEEINADASEPEVERAKATIIANNEEKEFDFGVLRTRYLKIAIYDSSFYT